MRAPAAGFALLVILLAGPFASPLAGAAEGSYEIDSTLRLADDGTLREARRVTYDAATSVQWAFPIPSDWRFLSAVDDRGQPIGATVEAQQVTFRTTQTGRDRWFEMTFSAPAGKNGPFAVGEVSIASAADSPVRFGTQLPAGWTLAGARPSVGAERTPAGGYESIGPLSLDFLLLPPGIEDPGADPRVSGSAVLREAVAQLGATGGTLDVVATYDTELYSPTWTLPLPPGAEVVSVETPFGPVEHEPRADGVRFELPYPTGFGLGARPFTVRYALPAPDVHGGSFLRANVSVAAGHGDPVSLEVRTDADVIVTGILHGDADEASARHFEARGPLTVSVGLLPPTAPGRARFDAGLFVVDVPDAFEPAARSVALRATELLPAVADFAGGGNQSRPFYIAYTDAPIFAWEEGFYTPGLNTISIRLDDLSPSADGVARLGPVRTLVHETTHGLVDRLLPNGPRNVSFLDEGLARLAETRVERAFPDEVLSCTGSIAGTRCERDSSRPVSAELRAYHAAGTTFPVGWSAATASEDARGFLYDYSGFVFDAFDRRAPRQALPALLWHMSLLEFEENAEADAARIVSLLLDHAPDLEREELLYPGRDIASLPADRFYACMGELVAPAYPFEEEARGERPASGCGSLDQGRGTGANPPPPEIPGGGLSRLIPGASLGVVSLALVLAALARRGR